jgi:cell division protease FtsH
MMGSERRSMIISDDEKKIIAYHESGHALVARLLPGTDPIHKVTIIPRGRALGLTQQLPMVEKHLYPREFLANDLAIYMGGRVAEELVLGHMTTGAGNDIERATELARKMVCEWGMSDKLGPLTFGKKEEHIFLGKDMGQRKDYSEETAEEIDTEIKKIVVENYARARMLLEGHVGALHRLAKALLEKEVLDGPEIEKLIYSDGGGKGPSGAPEPSGTPEPATAKAETLNPGEAASLGAAVKQAGPA